MKATAHKTMIVLFATILAMQTFALAQEKVPERPGDRPFAGPGRRQQHPERMLRRMIYRLDLTDDQIEHVKTIVKNNRETAEAAEKAVEQARNLVHKAVIKGAGETEVTAAVASLGTALTSRAVNKAATMASVRAILTEQQLKELDELGIERKGARGRFQRGMGPGRGRGGFRGRGQRGRWQKGGREYGRGDFGGRRWYEGGRGYGRGDFGGHRWYEGGRGYGRGEFGGRRWQEGGHGYGGRNFRRHDFGRDDFGRDWGRGYGGRGRGPWYEDREPSEEEHQDADND